MKDSLRGTFGCFLQIVLFVAGISLIVYGAGRSSQAVQILFIVLGVLCFCAVFGIRYALGNIFRVR